MVKIRLIFIKRFAFRRKGRNKQVLCRNEIDQKNILTDLFVWNKMVQSSLKWLLGSSRRYKRLTWRSQGQLHLRLWFCSNYKKKKKKTSLCTHRRMALFCDMNQSLIKSVWNYTKRHPRPSVLILWTSSFTLQVMKKLIFVANSHRPFIIVKWFLAWQTNTLNDCFRILTTLPASKLSDCYSYDPIVHGAKS